MFSSAGMRRPVAAITLAVATAWLGGCAALPGAPIERTPLPVGTSWVVQQANSGSYGSGTARVATRVGERTWAGERVLTQETDTGAFMSRASDGLRIGALGPNGQPAFLLDPPVGMQFPLAPGKAWTIQSTMTISPTGATVPFVSEWQAHDYEEVTVPAGTFRALRVSAVDKMRGVLWNDDSYWYAPALNTVVKSTLRRAAAHPAGAGVRESVMLERPRMP